MARAQNGDAAAYRHLLLAIAPYARSFAARCHRDPADVEDAVQDILTTVHAIRHTYDPARPFAPWFVTIANRRLVDRLRRQGRVRDREVPLAPEHEAFAAGRDSRDDETPGPRELQALVESLPPGQRQAIELLKIREMSLKEVSTTTGMSVAALKVATHRALVSLRQMVANKHGVS